MTLDPVLFFVAIILGVAAAVAGHPRPPRLDAERLFKVVLAHLLRGEVERDGGTPDAWESRVNRFLPFHPAGRQGWRKVADPASYSIPVPALLGEQGLMEALRRLSSPIERTRHLFKSAEALLEDPLVLGPDYAPDRWLGPGCDWDGLAAWALPVQEALVRKMEGRILVGLRPAGEPAFSPPPGLGFVDLPWTSEMDKQALTARLVEALDGAERRLVVVALGDTGPALLHALLDSEGLRDLVVGLVFVGCPLGGCQESFRHEVLDTELRRTTPYLFLPRIDLDAAEPGDGRCPWSEQRLDEPLQPASGRRPVGVVDLGPVSTAFPLGSVHLPRALALVLAALS